MMYEKTINNHGSLRQENNQAGPTKRDAPFWSLALSRDPLAQGFQGAFSDQKGQTLFFIINSKL